MSDPRELIQYYLGVYCGSSKRAVQKAANEIYAKNIHESLRKAESALYWLLDNGYIEYVPYNKMNDCEKGYYSSDNCDIYRVKKHFDEIQFINEKYK